METVRRHRRGDKETKQARKKKRKHSRGRKHKAKKKRRKHKKHSRRVSPHSSDPSQSPEPTSPLPNYSTEDHKAEEEPLADVDRQVQRVSASGACSVSDHPVCLAQLLRAVGLNLVHSVEEKLAHGANVNVRSLSGLTPLQCVPPDGGCGMLHGSMISFPPHHPLRVYFPSSWGHSIAAAGGFRHLAELLLDCGATLDAQDKDGPSCSRIVQVDQHPSQPTFPVVVTACRRDCLS